MFARIAEPSPQNNKTMSSKIAAVVGRFFSRAAARRRECRLHVCETLSLGEKRFLAVVEYDRQKFLLAGTPQNISLLQRLDEGAGKSDHRTHPESSLE
jgi:flagellar biogenesis protein FliO